MYVSRYPMRCPIMPACPTNEVLSTGISSTYHIGISRQLFPSHGLTALRISISSCLGGGKTYKQQPIISAMECNRYLPRVVSPRGLSIQQITNGANRRQCVTVIRITNSTGSVISIGAQCAGARGGRGALTPGFFFLLSFNLTICLR